MSDLNCVALTGRICNDPAITEVKQDNYVARVSLAVHGIKEDDTSFFNCDFWHPKVDFLRCLTKGKLVSIIGRLRQEKWEKDGQKRQAVKVIIEKLNFINTGHRPDKPQEGQEAF